MGNILIGDVWILGGQSNMEFELSKIDDGMLEIISANFPEIRLLTIPRGKGFDSVPSFEILHEWSDWSGRHFRKGDWDVCSPEAVKEFSAIGYVFGRRLHMAADIPIGLIDVSVGGTTVETWTPEDVVKGIEGQETKGMVAQWAEKIAAYDPQADLQKQTEENFLGPMRDVGALIREAQYMTFRDFRDAGDEEIGFVSTFDLRKSWYHPQIKIPAGERAAKWALATQYEILTGRDAQQYWLPPSVEQAELTDGTIKLTMSSEIRAKDDSDGKMLGFAIAGKDRRFVPADIQYYTDGSVDHRNRPQYKRNILVLSSPFVSEPAHYRHAWARNPMTNLTNSRQVPIATQRSDDWLMEETPIKFPMPPGADLKSLSRQLSGKIKKELELGDRERRILEAEATIAELKEEFLADKEAWEQSKAKEAEKIRAAHEQGR